MADPREEAIRRHYDRRSQPQSFLDQKAASSRPGQVYHTMTSLQDRMSRPGYTNNQADINQLKGLRRDWNRNQKYTPQGMRVSGATSPTDAQNRFMGTTENFRQANPRAYGTMYPKTQGAMKAGESGGLLGLVIRGLKGDLGKLGQDIKNKIGITGIVDDTVDAQEKYATDTFGPHLEDIEELDFTEEYAGPWPHDDMPPIGEIETPLEVNIPVPAQNIPRPHEGMPPIMGDAEAKWERYKRDVIEQKRKLDLSLDASMRGHPHKEYYQPDPSRLGKAAPHLGEDITVAPWLTDPSIPMPEEEVPVPLPPYQGREFGLGQFMDTMPRDWQDYLEDLERVGDMPGGHLTYDEWHDAMRRRR